MPSNSQVAFLVFGSPIEYKIMFHTFPLCAIHTLLCFGQTIMGCECAQFNIDNNIASMGPLLVHIKCLSA
jgi:hypothetical protein